MQQSNWGKVLTLPTKSCSLQAKWEQPSLSLASLQVSPNHPDADAQISLWMSLGTQPSGFWFSSIRAEEEIPTGEESCEFTVQPGSPACIQQKELDKSPNQS